MLIHMLTVGTTPTSVGISTLTNNPLDLAEYHGDEDGGYILPCTSYFILNGYYKESDTSILHNSIELTVEYNPDIKTITCTISVPPLDEATILDEDTFLDDATVSSTKYYREADIKALIANPNRLTIVRNDITTLLRELNSSYSFTR